MNNYLIVYDEIYSLNQEIDKIITKEYESATKNIYDLTLTTLENALIDLDTYSFLSDKKIIIIKNIDLLQDDKDTKHLLKYLENPNEDNLLIMTTTKFLSTKKINKELQKLTKFIKLETDIEKEVKNILKDYKIDNKLIRKIIEYSNNNIDIIKTECDKLISYKDKDKNIIDEDIEKIVVKHLGEANNIVFDLIKYIATIDKKRAVEKYLLLEEYNIDDISLIGLLESQLRLMLQISTLMDERMTKDMIAKELKQHPYRIQKTMELLREVSNKKIIKLIQSLSNMDYKIKSGKIDSKESILIYILNM